MNNSIGYGAEDDFRKLCTFSNVNAVKSDRDIYGWDYLIEVPPKDQISVSADLQQGVKQALVQIKATSTNKKSTRLTIQNALNLTKTELPCFVILFQYHGEEYKIYAKHFHLQLMRKTLERARKISFQHGKLNKSWITISFKEGDNKTKNLLDWLIEQIRGFPDQYGIHKRNAANSLGYEAKDSRKATITLELPGGEQELVDLQIGLKDSVKTRKIEFKDKRFGIENPFPNVLESSGTLKISQTDPPKCRISLESQSGERIVTEATILAPQLNVLSKESFRFQLVSNAFRIIGIIDGAWEIKTSLVETKPVEDLEKTCRLLSWGGDIVTFEIRSKHLNFKEQGKLELTGYNYFYHTLASACSTLIDLEQILSINIGDYTVLELEKFYGELLAVYCLMERSISLSFEELDISTDNLHNCNRIVAFFNFKLKELTISFIVDIDTYIQNNNLDQSRITFVFESRKIIDCFVGKEELLVLQNCEEHYLDYINKFDNSCLAIGNIRDTLLIESNKLRSPQNRN